MEQVVTTVIAVIVSLTAMAGLFAGLNWLVDRRPEAEQARWRPWVFLGPAMVFLLGWLVIPAIRTIWISLFDRTSENVVGLDNVTWALTDGEMVAVLRNNVVWLVGVTVFSTGIGLLLAALADRMRSEKAITTLILMPMAISFAAASVVWRLVYAYRPAGRDQIGMLNAAWTGLGQEPVAWLVQPPVNTFFLIVIMIWMLTGFAMVVLSAAIKGVPTELIEAARVDGATEVQIFRRITIPSIKGSIAVVGTITMVLALKVYDIVKVTTDGNVGTNVLANEMFEQSFRFGELGQGAALAVIIFVATIPAMFLLVRRVRRDEAVR